MQTIQSPSAAEPVAATNRPAPKPPATRVVPGLVLVAIFWAVHTAAALAGWPISSTFFARAGACALLTLLFPLWWLTNRSVRMRDRLLALAVMIVGCGLAIAVSRQTLGTIGVLFMGLPFVFTGWVLWLLVSRKWSPGVQRVGLAITVSLVWCSMGLVRMDGITGDLQANIQWRWAPRPEDAYLASRSPDAGLQSATERPIELAAGDWPALRGPASDGRMRGVKIATDWKASPPQLVWRQRIGPAWSSPIIVSGRLFTQEQVGDMESVVCLDAATGKRLWTHGDKARLRDAQGGDGPRGTPAFDNGRLYTQGATGILNCLDAATGRVKWTRDLVKDSGAPLPMWGFSSSPLVVDGVVITFAGASADKGLLAYHADSGKPAWTAATGPISYCSPELVSLGGVQDSGQRQVLFLSDQGLVALEPRSGKVCWKFDAPKNGIWRAVQPAAIDPASVLVGSEDLGLVRLRLAHDANAWTVERRWASKAMKPGYNDFAIHEGFAYGFDSSIFCCVDLDSGKRRWKQGRYGHGQVLLLADQGLLLVTSETGEVVLLEATPEAHHELARFQAIEGKTWNHPVVAHGCLFVRNDEEIACYRLAVADASSGRKR
ncbi:MAG TPA: PQQ-binding-like beta-propeller repeat protein [Pirellulales bacterium]